MKGRFLIAAATVALARLAYGAESTEPFTGYTKYERYEIAYEVNADGTHVEHRAWAIRVLAEQGVNAANDTSLSYSDRLQDAQIEEAYTQKADGRRIDAPPSNFQEHASTGKGESTPMFSDLRSKTVVFPDVAVGDLVVFRATLRQKEAVFPGHFSMTEGFSRAYVYDSATVTLTAPEALPLQVEGREVEGGLVGVEHAVRTWRWSYRNATVRTPEPGELSAYDAGPLVVASTFKDYGVIAAAYEDRHRPAAAATDTVRKLAEEITQGATEPREQAKRLYDWVAKNINFAGNCVGTGSVVPHPVDRVLENKLGDCKDHTALLESLLAAKGIASTPALVNSGETYTLPKVPTVWVFNHVINYIPSLDLYADSTARFTPFGTLPEDERGKPTLHTAAFDGVRTTPAQDYRENRTLAKTTLHVHDDGSADGETEIEVGTDAASGIRSWVTYLRPNLHELTVRRILSSAGFTGTGSLVLPTAAELDQPRFRYGARFHVDVLMDLPGPTGWAVRSPFGSGSTIGRFLASLNEPPPTRDFRCDGGIGREEIVLELPKHVKLFALPRNVSVSSPNAAYEATYRSKGQRVEIVREFQDRTVGSICKPQASADFRPVGLAAAKDLRAQILYR